MEIIPGGAAREKTIVRTSFLGIGVNVLLAAFKAAVGLIAGSIAVVLDAVNNLTDALSSVITVIGTKIANRTPDKKHPLGHGRVEYISSMLISALMLYAGITALVESIKKIIHPSPADYSIVSLIIIGAAVIAKVLLGTFVRRTGKRVNSGALIASGSDALFDAILSASVLVSAIVFTLTGLSLEAYVGVVISLFIIKSGVQMLLESFDEIVGRRMDPEISDKIRDAVNEDPDVLGAYDLILNSYGPERVIGSVHVEVPDTMTADKIDAMQRRIAGRVYREHGVMLTGIGIYSQSTGEQAAALREEALRIVTSHPEVLQMHGFRADEEQKYITLDVIIDYGVKNRHEVFANICRELEEAFPGYNVTAVLDIDI